MKGDARCSSIAPCVHSLMHSILCAVWLAGQADSTTGREHRGSRSESDIAATRTTATDLCVTCLLLLLPCLLCLAE